MADIFTKQKRSEVMSRIRSRGNKDTEGALVKIFRAEKITGWRRQVEIRIKKVEGRMQKEGKGKARAHASTDLRFNPLTKPFKVRPDFVFQRARVAVFVDGCFWHGCPRHGTKPSSNKSFWREKLAKNRERDRRVTRTLRRAGWQVVRIWEHALAEAARKPAAYRRLVGKIKSKI